MYTSIERDVCCVASDVAQMKKVFLFFGLVMDEADGTGRGRGRGKTGGLTCCSGSITISSFMVTQNEVGHFEIFVDSNGADVESVVPEEGQVIRGKPVCKREEKATLERTALKRKEFTYSYRY